MGQLFALPPLAPGIIVSGNKQMISLDHKIMEIHLNASNTLNEHAFAKTAILRNTN